MSILFLLVGLGLILSGANFLTDGAAALAKRFNISSLVIGLTIVAFGTSAPELTVSIVSAINGSAELSIGNVVGSNIFNILMIVGDSSCCSYNNNQRNIDKRNTSRHSLVCGCLNLC